MKELSTRANTCIAQIVRNNEAKITDSTSGTNFFGNILGAGGRGHSGGIQGGQVIVTTICSAAVS